VNKQEMFDAIVTGLAAQGWRQSTDQAQDLCRYRSHDGLKCAIGHLITDGNYTPDLEISRATCPTVQDALPEQYRYTKTDWSTYDFTEAAQRAHDCAGMGAQMWDRFRALAKVYGLDASRMGPRPFSTETETE